MGFIRAYSARDKYEGDPFRLRIPKGIKKLKVGRALGKVAKAAVAFVPGVGPIAAGILGGIPTAGGAVIPEAGALPPAGAEWDDENPGRGFSWVRPPQGHPAWGFARSNGWDMGDPKVRKGKMAGAGPKAKATRKANSRQAKATGATPKSSGSSARGKGPSWDSLARNFVGAASSMGGTAMRALKGGGVQSVAQEAFDFHLPKAGGSGAGIMVRHAGGGGRRSMNVTNVHALKRGLRRLEGFEKLVKRIEKQYPRIKRATGHASSGRPGHKAGCRCVACK